MPFKIDKLIQRKIVSNKPFAHKYLDSVLKWAPFASIFVFDALGCKMKNSFKRRVMLACLSEGIQAAITESLKKNIHEFRPQPSLSSQSFPSGHTATSFAGAEILRTELKTSHPVLAWSGYTVAVAAAVLRLYDNKHWFSDVTAGAAIGIISTQIAVALFDKLKRNKFNGQEDKQLVD